MKNNIKEKENLKATTQKVPFGKIPTRLYNKNKKKSNLEIFYEFLKENKIDIYTFENLLVNIKQ